MIRPVRRADRAYFRIALAPGKRIGKYALPVALWRQDKLIWNTILVDLGMNRGPTLGLPLQEQEEEGFEGLLEVGAWQKG